MVFSCSPSLSPPHSFVVPLKFSRAHFSSLSSLSSSKMANACLNSYSSSSSTLLCKNRPTDRFSIPSSSSSLGFPFSSALHCALASSVFGSQNKHRVLRILAITKEEVPVSDVATTTTPPPVEEPAKGESKNPKVPKPQTCELYVCNLPRSCDIAELAQMFKPYGTIHSVEVSRNLETGISKGCGFVTMSTRTEAKAAISALNGSDVGGREMMVRYSKNNNKRINDSPSSDSSKDSSSTKNKINFIYETPHKIYVGNLPWSVRPEDLRVHFSQFGTVVSTRLLYDRKGERNRVFGFLSFSKAEESEAAVASSGSNFHGRKLLARAAIRIPKTSET